MASLSYRCEGSPPPWPGLCADDDNVQTGSFSIDVYTPPLARVQWLSPTVGTPPPAPSPTNFTVLTFLCVRLTSLHDLKPSFASSHETSPRVTEGGESTLCSVSGVTFHRSLSALERDLTSNWRGECSRHHLPLCLSLYFLSNDGWTIHVVIWS